VAAPLEIVIECMTPRPHGQDKERNDTVRPTSDPIGFGADIKPLFREVDRAAKLSASDLWSPCDMVWPAERVAVFRRWFEARPIFSTPASPWRSTPLAEPSFGTRASRSLARPFARRVEPVGLRTADSLGHKRYTYPRVAVR
jgi:hypothetical protein